MRTIDSINVTNNNILLIRGIFRADFSDINRPVSAEISGKASTPNASHAKADEEVASVNFFLLGH